MEVVQPNSGCVAEQSSVEASEAYLFQSPDGPTGRAGKCNYCHEFAGRQGGFPIIAKVNRCIQGRFQTDKPEGEPWFIRGEYSHREHRSIQCESCHTEARTSTKTSDVLIPVMKACLPCHADGRGAGLDRCSECHLYHNKSQEKEQFGDPRSRSCPHSRAEPYRVPGGLQSVCNSLINRCRGRSDDDEVSADEKGNSDTDDAGGSGGESGSLRRIHMSEPEGAVPRIAMGAPPR